MLSLRKNTKINPKVWDITGNEVNSIREIISSVNNSEFSIIYVGGEKGGCFALTSPTIRLERNVQIPRLSLDEEGFSIHEGYLSCPMFKPLCKPLRDPLLPDLDNMNRNFVLEWRFKRKRDNMNLINMYVDYLEGNDYPFYYSVPRKIQTNVIRKISKETREPIEEMEDKVTDNLFYFNLTVGGSKSSLEKIRNLLSNYDFYNSIQLKEIDKKSYLNSKYYKNNNVLSRKEILNLFLRELNEKVEGNTIEKEKREGSLYSILPNSRSKNKDTTVDAQTVVSDVAEALKRVKIIKTARVFNEKVAVGVRLIVVQFDIPKNKTISQLISRTKDIQAALGVSSLGIEQGDEPDTVKLMLPNSSPSIVSLGELVKTEEFKKESSKKSLVFPVGVDEINKPIYLSLSELVHLLVAGTTGSGKSVFINSLAVSLIINYTPQELNLVLIDPKEVELQHFKDIPHVSHLETDMERAEGLLSYLALEMDNRYSKFKEVGVKNIHLYNTSPNVSQTMPFIVCIIDEYADLKDMYPEVEKHIARLGQKARAAGIHLVIATQRPSTDIISGRVKAVLPNAISFNLNNNTNYKTVFGTGIPLSGGLLGNGDGIMKIEGYQKEFQRFQSPIVSPDEAEEVRVYNQLANYYANYVSSPTEFVGSPSTEEGKLKELKTVIANTGETRVASLRKELGVKTERMQELMNKLVEEGWLTKHKSKAKGYELIAPEEKLLKYKNVIEKG